MAKQQYIQPTVEVCELRVSNLMLSVSMGNGNGPGSTQAPRRGQPIE